VSQPGLTLEELLGFVEKAACGDRRLLVQLFRTLQQLAHHPTAPLAERQVGAILSLVLMGERSPDLSSLPTDMADEIRTLLARLEAPSSLVQTSGGP
jgi:hypothetical protein